jgi:hypothetical protein
VFPFLLKQHTVFLFCSVYGSLFALLILLLALNISLLILVPLIEFLGIGLSLLIFNALHKAHVNSKPELFNKTYAWLIGLSSLLFSVTALLIIGQFFETGSFWMSEMTVGILFISLAKFVRHLYIAQIIRSLEQGRAVHWYNTLGTAILLSNLPIGIWNLHPRLKMLCH